MKIEVAYASRNTQCVLAIEIEEGGTVQSAIELSGILTKFPEINLKTQSVGIFSKKCKLSDLVHAGDRIEIYRPLLIDPKEARRTRAKKVK
jgi:putative ubiquitin-RnfH superfamily antitoxin RatB of RatAB toxin-antitoxin module